MLGCIIMDKIMISYTKCKLFQIHKMTCFCLIKFIALQSLLTYMYNSYRNDKVVCIIWSYIHFGLIKTCSRYEQLGILELLQLCSIMRVISAGFSLMYLVLLTFTEPSGLNKSILVYNAL